MEIRNLLTVLEQLRRLYAAGGAKPTEKDIAKLIACLMPHASQTVEAFVAKVGSAAIPAAAGRRARFSVVNEELADQYASRLIGAGTDRNAFDQIFAELSGDTSARLKEADAIARKFTHHQSPFKTKKAALTAIKQTFVERARFENKLRAVS